jgi:hypothetical protein
MARNTGRRRSGCFGVNGAPLRSDFGSGSVFVPSGAEAASAGCIKRWPCSSRPISSIEVVFTIHWHRIRFCSHTISGVGNRAKFSGGPSSKNAPSRNAKNVAMARTKMAAGYPLAG